MFDVENACQMVVGIVVEYEREGDVEGPHHELRIYWTSLMNEINGILAPNHFTNINNRVRRGFPFLNEIVYVLCMVITKSDVSIPHESVSVIFVFVVFRGTSWMRNVFVHFHDENLWCFVPLF